jgi:hypothetical protein
MDLLISWGQAVAASGMTAIAYSNERPSSDVHTLVNYIKQNAASLEIDENRIGVYSSSGNVPNALSLLMGGRETLRCAVLNYGYMLDLDGSTAVADAARSFGFVTPCAGKTVDDLRDDIPLFITRAGKEQFAGLNDSIDRFVAKALTRNLPITLSNLPSVPHAYDMVDAGRDSIQAIQQTLAFFRSHLLD